MSDNTFFQSVFSKYWKIHQAQEPTRYYSLREALAFFRNYTKLNKEQLASQLSMSVYALNMAEAGRRKFSLAQYDRLIHLCRNYDLYRLLEYFDTWKDSVVIRTPTTKGRNVYGGGGATPNWRDMMGV